MLKRYPLQLLGEQFYELKRLGKTQHNLSIIAMHNNNQFLLELSMWEKHETRLADLKLNKLLLGQLLNMILNNDSDGNVVG